jgi:hypothetical protein
MQLTESGPTFAAWFGRQWPLFGRRTYAMPDGTVLCRELKLAFVSLSRIAPAAQAAADIAAADPNDPTSSGERAN